MAREKLPWRCRPAGWDGDDELLGGWFLIGRRVPFIIISVFAKAYFFLSFFSSEFLQ